MENRTSLSRLTTGLTFCLITLFGVGLILFTKDVSAAASAAVTLCARTVIPSLFPFLVLSSLCITTGMGGAIARSVARPMELLFHLPGSCAPALILGVIGGYPVGAKTAFDLYDRKDCTREECSRLLTFCSCCGPAFLCSAAGMAVLGSLQAGLVLCGCHLLAALIIGVVQGRFLPRPDRHQASSAVLPESFFAHTFTQAVSSSFASMLNVCGFVIFFAAALAFLDCSGGLSLLQKILFFLPQDLSEPLLRGMIEMTGGVTSLKNTAGLTFPQAMSLAGLISGWGGLSVHAQVLSLREDRPIPMGQYFVGKIFHGLLAGVFSYAAALYCLPDLSHHSVFAPTYELQGTGAVNPLYYILVCGVYLAACLAVTALVIWLEDREERKEGCKSDRKTV